MKKIISSISQILCLHLRARNSLAFLLSHPLYFPPSSSCHSNFLLPFSVIFSSRSLCVPCHSLFPSVKVKINSYSNKCSNHPNKSSALSLVIQTVSYAGSLVLLTGQNAFLLQKGAVFHSLFIQNEKTDSREMRN